LTVVVSTHFDDAVFSCYSVLGAETTVVTVLAGFPVEDMLGDWDAEGGATSSVDRVRERRAEDAAALSLSRSRGVHLDFLDKQYWDPSGPSLEELASGLAPHLVGTVYAPAGIGNHQHALVRDAVLAIRPDAVLYADLPYALKHGFGEPGRDVVLDEGTVVEKLAASRCYATQLAQLVADFGDFVSADALRRERFSR
jgi:LmbE family N-acetylglucosaminyl deacetylase